MAKIDAPKLPEGLFWIVREDSVVIAKWSEWSCWYEGKFDVPNSEWRSRDVESSFFDKLFNWDFKLKWVQYSYRHPITVHSLSAKLLGQATVVDSKNVQQLMVGALKDYNAKLEREKLYGIVS
jgi:hypothetical protein